jgi:regulator of RNase E activity RraB
MEAMGQQIIEQLRGVGSDLSKPHLIDFYFYFPTIEIAERAARELQKKSLQTEIQEGADGENWLCLASAMFLPSEIELTQLGSYFGDLADSLGGEFDGWETEVLEQ